MVKVKRLMAILMSVMMLFSTAPLNSVNVKADATDAKAGECNHILTAEDVENLPDSFWEDHSRDEYREGAPAFIGVRVPEGCVTDGWRIEKTDSTGFCMLCGEVITEGDKIALQAKGHNFDTVVKEPTCTEEGENKCSNENYELKVTEDDGIYSATLVKTACEETKQVAALGHQWSDEIEEKTDATCTEKGHVKVTKTCNVCGETEVVKDEETDALGHDWDVKTSTVDATCTEKGSVTTTKTCKVCGEVEEDVEYSDALGHDYTAEIIQEADCVKQEIVKYTCTRCGDSYVETGEALGHTGDDLKVTREPNCVDYGTKEGICERCGKYVVIALDPDPNNHNYVADASLDETVEATCTTKGSVTHYEVCSRCGDKKVSSVDEIPELGHDYQLTNKVEPTCTEDGSETYTCTRCGDTYTTTLEKLGHTNLTVTLEPTCDSFGKREGTCERCGKYIVEAIEPLGHIYEVETKEATCTEDGYVKYTCQRCGDVYYESYTAKLGHDYVADPSLDVTVDATCEEKGSVTHYEVCSRCDDKKVSSVDEIPALGHDPAEPVVVEVAATCTTDGSKTTTVKCNRCDKVLSEEVEVLPKLGHDYQETDRLDPTCTEAGYIVRTCTRCGEVNVEDLPAKGHQFDDTATTTPANCVHGNIFDGTCIVCGEQIVKEDDARDYSIELENGDEYKFTRLDDEVAEDTYYVEFKYTNQNSYYNEFSEEFDILGTISHTGHDYEVKYTKATCEEDGYWTLTCIREGCPDPDAETAKNEVVTVINANTATGHDWHLLDDDSSKAPTCTEEGYRHYLCMNDHSHTYTETIPALGHNYKITESVDATCTTEGYDVYTCERCGDSYNKTTTPAKGHIETVIDTVSATCTTEGYDVHKCSVCGETWNVTTTPALGHNYKMTESVASTCAKEGYNVYTCTRCDDTYTQIIAKIPHKGVVTGTVSATCTTEGYDIYTCKECGETWNVTTTPAKGHHFVETGYVAPTCTEQGVRTYKCTDCDETYNTYEKALGHNYGKVTIVEATCTDEGYTIHSCTNPGCTDSYVTDKTAKVPHVLSVVDQKAPTCAEDGYETRACANCDYTETKVLPATGNHVYDNAVTKEATCTEDGVMTYTCKECGTTYTEVIPAIGHNFGKTEVVEATCTENGYTVYTCTNPGCTETYTTDETDKIDHVLSVVDQKAATCTEDGFVKKACANCDYTETEVIPATGHNFGKTEVNEPTCTTEGGTRYTCTNPGCTVFYDTDVTDKIDHVLSVIEQKDATCTENGYVVKGCANCDYTEKEVIPATDHIFDTEGVNTPATCEKEGYTTYTCAVCGKKQVVKTAEKLGHVYKSEVSATATFDKDGMQTEVCIHCGKKIVSNAITAIKSVTLAQKKFAYTGKNILPAVIVKDAKGNTVSSKYYTVTYANNKKIGVATATVTFKGLYTGTVKLKYTIVPKGVGISKTSSTKKTIRYTWGRVKNADGYKIQYSTSKNFKKAKKVTIKNRKTCVTYLKNLKSGKKYYVRVRAYKKVSGKTYYGDWSSSSRICK